MGTESKMLEICFDIPEFICLLNCELRVNQFVRSVLFCIFQFTVAVNNSGDTQDEKSRAFCRWVDERRRRRVKLPARII